MHPIFKDPNLQSQLEQNGFVTMPMVEKNELECLKQLFEEIRPKEVLGIYSNVNGNTRENNIKVDMTIRKVFNSHVENLFCDYKIGGGTFLVKGANKQSASTLHQDWNSVDESNCVSLSIWCPLVDVDEKNGCLQVIPGSHQLFNAKRCITVPSIFLDFDKDVSPYIQSVPLKAGEVCIYAHNLFHGSKPNYSGEVRVAAVMGILPNQKPHIHYYRTPSSNESKLDIYEIDMEFFYEGLTELHSGKRPEKFKIIGEVEDFKGPLSKGEVLKALQLKFGQPNHTIWTRIKNALTGQKNE